MLEVAATDAIIISIPLDFCNSCIKEISDIPIKVRDFPL